MMDTQLTLRAACSECGSLTGTYRVTGLQRPVYCECGVYQRYNASRDETGEIPTSIRSQADVPSSQRQRIFERDAFRCVMCGRSPSDGIRLQIDHLVSRIDLARYGLTKPAEVNSDANLATTCEECNLGHGSRSIAPVALLALSVAIARKQDRKKNDGVA